MNETENILKDLFCGNICPIDKILKSNDENIDKTTKQLDRLHFNISESIKDDTLFLQFNEYEKMHGIYEELICQKAFEEGFSLAAKLICASLNK